ncbi:MAG: TIGR01777 family oxidoreductase [Proteobacteria bacterium]|nr:TIGR01777 family oxidoreductase [Pseudomonadota bacterium]MBU1387624.1 TIGR01777 family oxidoreductase [Pseudomonadota bacterium]MBU1544215.1 TIGR01777 family oxidoreductase [Pseudomonadota bacterium]MBU2429618.1 TIGR01777 family oxidoreductase [Pseudomonadota bacterium]
MKNIMITGASGFIGKNLSRYLLLKNYHVSGVGTSKNHPFSKEFMNFEWISADTTVQGDWQEKIDQADTIINLTGKSIFSYWTPKYKQDIYNSRILTTRHIVQAIKNGTGKQLLSASAVGIYGHCGDALLNEDSEPGEDFLAHVCRDWENEALKAKDKNVRVSILRLGVVLGNGGALSTMVPAFKFFAGGPLGSGKQWFPWVHIKDLEQAVEFIIEEQDLAGVFNLVGPQPVQQKQLAKSLGRALNRPAFMPAPACVIRLFMGELGKSLLQSQKVVPTRLIQSGCDFEFKTVEDALKDIFKK